MVERTRYRGDHSSAVALNEDLVANPIAGLLQLQNVPNEGIAIAHTL